METLFSSEEIRSWVEQAAVRSEGLSQLEAEMYSRFLQAVLDPAACNVNLALNRQAQVRLLPSTEKTTIDLKKPPTPNIAAAVSYKNGLTGKCTWFLPPDAAFKLGRLLIEESGGRNEPADLKQSQEVLRIFLDTFHKELETWLGIELSAQVHIYTSTGGTHTELQTAFNGIDLHWLPGVVDVKGSGELKFYYAVSQRLLKKQLHFSLTHISSADSDDAPSSHSRVSTPAVLEGHDNLMLIENVPLKVRAELGETSIMCRELLSLTEGAVLNVDQGDREVRLFVEDRCIATGEVISSEEGFEVRITNIISPLARLNQMHY